MTDHQDQSDHNQPDPTDGNDSALERDDLQRVQDQAGIAGEPQPTDTESDDSELAETPPTDPQSNEALDQEPTAPPGYGGA